MPLFGKFVLAFATNSKRTKYTYEKGRLIEPPFFIVCTENFVATVLKSAARLFPDQPHKAFFGFGVGFKGAGHGLGDAGDVGFVDASG